MKRLASLLALLVLASARWAADPAERALRVGSKRFAESYILAHLMAQTIALYPEYAGTISLEILKRSEPMTLAQMNHALAPLGLGAAIPLGFNDGYALAMRATELRLQPRRSAPPNGRRAASTGHRETKRHLLPTKNFSSRPGWGAFRPMPLCAAEHRNEGWGVAGSDVRRRARGPTGP